MNETLLTQHLLVLSGILFCIGMLGFLISQGCYYDFDLCRNYVKRS